MLIRFTKSNHPEVAINTDTIMAVSYREMNHEDEYAYPKIVITFINNTFRFHKINDGMWFEFQSNDEMFKAWNRLVEIMGYEEI